MLALLLTHVSTIALAVAFGDAGRPLDRFVSLVCEHK